MSAQTECSLRSKSIYFNVFIKINGQSSNSKTTALSFMLLLYFFGSAFACEFMLSFISSEQCLPNTFCCCSIGFLWHWHNIIEKLQHLVKPIDYLSFRLIHEFVHAYERRIQIRGNAKKKTFLRTLNFALSQAPNFQHFDSMSRCSHFN